MSISSAFNTGGGIVPTLQMRKLRCRELNNLLSLKAKWVTGGM